MTPLTDSGVISIAPILGFSEPVSSWLHLFAALAFAVRGLWMLWLDRPRSRHVAALTVFVCGVVVLFLMSGVYHLLEPNQTPRLVMQRLDHAAIWLLIAATFTPVHLIAFRGFWRWGILGPIWGFAAGGIVVSTLLANQIPESVELALYLILGWVGMVTIWQLIRRRTWRGAALLLGGGVCYSAGALLDFTRAPIIIPYIMGPHEIFHLAVIAGVALHWHFISRLASPASRSTPAVATATDRSGFVR